MMNVAADSGDEVVGFYKRKIPLLVYLHGPRGVRSSFSEIPTGWRVFASPFHSQVHVLQGQGHARYLRSWKKTGPESNGHARDSRSCNEEDVVEGHSFAGTGRALMELLPLIGAANARAFGKGWKEGRG